MNLEIIMSYSVQTLHGQPSGAFVRYNKKYTPSEETGFWMNEKGGEEVLCILTLLLQLFIFQSVSKFTVPTPSVCFIATKARTDQ